MKINGVLTVCIGNICRSPVAEAALAKLLPDVRVESAGLAAPSGSHAHPFMRELAPSAGLDLSAHRARKIDAIDTSPYDLILVMETAHRAQIANRFPHLAGRTMLLSQWTDGQDIGDPVDHAREVHKLVFDQIMSGAQAWAERLG